MAVRGVDTDRGGRGIRGHIDHGLPRGRGVAVAGRVLGDIGGDFEGDIARRGVRGEGGGVTDAAAAKRRDRCAADADIAARKAADTFRETDAQGKGRAAVVAVWGILDLHAGPGGVARFTAATPATAGRKDEQKQGGSSAALRWEPVHLYRHKRNNFSTG